MGGFTQQIHHRMIELQHFSIGYKENSLLRDLVKIFHPELVQEECVYYKQLK